MRAPPRSRHLLAFAAILALALPLVPGAGAQVRDQRRVEAAPHVVAHEWGVWLLERGRVAHLDELAAELPDFARPAAPPPVVQGPLPQIPPPRPPRPNPPPPPRPPPPPFDHPPVARKPVLFLSTDRPVDVRVEVGFQGGQPWLGYPSAQTTPRGIGGAPSFVFEGRLEPWLGHALPAAPHGHFWNDIRAAGRGTIVARDGTPERFIFYDGPVAFERSFEVEWRGMGAAVIPASSEKTIWLVNGGLYNESELDSGTRSARVVAQGDMAMLRTRLDDELRARGLTAAESHSLLETWRDNLFTDATTRAIYFVPRDAYDRMLPISIDPVPAELVRVGVVIEHLM
jgi:hypothetical protein